MKAPVTPGGGLRRVEHIMGTAISVHLATPLPEETLQTMANDVFAWFRVVDHRFSTYRDDSEVNRLHRGEIRLTDCSADLRYVIEACADLWRATEGSFDAYATGRLDPSGYVKGWAVQVASDRLLDAGCPDHCLNAGGDIRVRGTSAPGQPWRVGVRHPWQEDKICLVLEGSDLAIATSGVYERGHHVIDPHSGRPTLGLRSVTVVGYDLALCDAYATAALAKGAAGIPWLSHLRGYDYAVITDAGECHRSAGWVNQAGGGHPETDAAR
jgi:thiamine biosynthesis lipoprotein